MAVAWYGVKVWMLVSPDGQSRSIATRPTHSYAWEMWTVDRRGDGTNVTVPQNIHRKYDKYKMDAAYDTEYDGVSDATIPTAALLRVEYPDGEQPPIESADYNVILNTQAKWNTAMAQYPTLKYRFVDQPYYPKV